MQKICKSRQKLQKWSRVAPIIEFIVVAAGASRPDRCDYTHREGNRLLTRATIAFSVDLDTLKPAANALTTRDKLATN